jgi:pyruvate kinase
MMRAGMDVVRLNCSHGSHRKLEGLIKMVRGLNRKYRRRIRILLDLEGPRIRVGRLQGRKPMILKRGQVLWLKKEPFRGAGNVVPIDYPGPLSDIEDAEHIFIDDGNICLKVHGIEENRIMTRVVVGGLLKEHKGVNIPGTRLSIPDITEKDVRDIHFGIHQGVDMIAQSFVRHEAPMA